ncbi:MBG domain-containing protein [Longitalea luteola]|uniref:MBG domain-containing protein n=1 Tax=Longitalea luteola TaxID=2812563 RepID=UPI001A96720D|nr:MBG domain-containing protein [Longitalea luteola]
MRSVYTLIIVLFITQLSFGQVALTPVIFPRYVQGGGTNSAKVPFVCRVTITGLNANTTYRYYNRFVTSITDQGNGEGVYYLIKPNGSLFRASFPSLSSVSNNAGVLTTDGSGSYTGWFITEPGSGAASIFVPNTEIYFRIILNDGTSSSSPVHRPTVTIPVKVIDFGSGATEGTAIRSTPVTGGTARNFVFLWDVTDPIGAQPVSGTYIEADEIDNSSGLGFASFYVDHVNNKSQTWGTIIPNNLPNGIKRINQYSVTGAVETGYKISTNSLWPVEGGGKASTVNPNGGSTNVIVLNGAIARLDGANLKTDQTITFNALTARTYGDDNFDAGATTSAGLPLTYASDNTAVAEIVTVNNQMLVAIKGAGNANITASQPGDDFFNAASQKVEVLTVNKAELTVTADDHQVLQGDPIPALTVTYSGFKNGDDAADLSTQPVATTTASQSSPAGDYEVRPDGGAAANYDFKYISGKLTIVPSKQPQTITFAPVPDKTYGDVAFDPGARAGSGLPIKYVSSNTAVADTANGRVVIKGVGTTTITAKQDGNSGWLAAPDVSVTLTVNRGKLTITAENKTRKVGEPNPTFTLLYSGFVYGETPAVLTAQPVAATTAAVNSPAGTYKITVNGAAAANYTIDYVEGDLIIEPLAVQTITFTAFSEKKYGDANFRLNASASSNLPVTFSSSNPAVAIIRNDSLIILTAGTSVITASQSGNAIWGPASASQTLTVQKARLIIKADTLTKNEGQPVPALTITYSGFVKNEDAGVLTALPTVTTTATANSVPGNYPIIVSGAAALNYSVAQLNGVVIVLPGHGAVQDNMFAYISRPGQLQVNIFSVTGGKGVIQLFDLNGTRLVNVNVALGKGNNTFQVPVGNVAPGIYSVRTAVAGVLLKTKLIIQ